MECIPNNPPSIIKKLIYTDTQTQMHGLKDDLLGPDCL
jgi:hypothetical protein